MPADRHLELAYMHGGRRQELKEAAAVHTHLRSGFPYLPEGGECEVCDVLWLIENDEGDRLDNYFNLRDALRGAAESSDAR